MNMKDVMLIFAVAAMSIMFALISMLFAGAARAADYGVMHDGGWKYGTVHSLEQAPGYLAGTVGEMMAPRRFKWVAVT